MVRSRASIRTGNSLPSRIKTCIDQERTSSSSGVGVPVHAPTLATWPVDGPGATPQLDKGKRLSQASKNSADSCYGRPYEPPVHGITVVDPAEKPGFAFRRTGSLGYVRYGLACCLTCGRAMSVRERPFIARVNGTVTVVRPALIVGPCSSPVLDSLVADPRWHYYWQGECATLNPQAILPPRTQNEAFYQTWARRRGGKVCRRSFE